VFASLSSFVRASFHRLVLAAIVAVVFGLGGRSGWRCLALCLWHRDWAALDYYTDVVYMEWVCLSSSWVHLQGAKLVGWLSGLLPPAPSDSLDPSPF
jgi:hypothetical protein